MKVAIIGGGAAGHFAAIELKRLCADVEVSIFEGSRKVLTKVGLSGGGRCNLTNSFENIGNKYAEAYPRGHKLIKKAFKVFDYKDAYEWFEAEGVHLLTQEDECVFPCSQSSAEIVFTLTRLCEQLGVRTQKEHRLTKAKKTENGKYSLYFNNSLEPYYCEFDCLVITTGGCTESFKRILNIDLGQELCPTVPSLFSFCIESKALKSLMGTVVENVEVCIPGTKLKSNGPLLVTHWGMSGPAILKLSSYAALLLAEANYKGIISVNWLGSLRDVDAQELIAEQIEKQGQKQLSTVRLANLPSRLWLHIISQAGLQGERRWAELGKKNINKLVNVLTNDQYVISGKNKFKDEFVTCGGVSLSSINQSSLESKTSSGLYFAGEVLDIDAITGGFNLQAAWTTAFVVAKSIAERNAQF